MIDYTKFLFLTYSLHGMTTDSLHDLKALFPLSGRITGVRPWFVAQNLACKKFLASDAQYTHLIMVAADLIIDRKQLDLMLEATNEYDIVGTSFHQHTPYQEIHSEWVPGSCLIISRKVLESREEGVWFFWGNIGEGDKLGRVMCDCDWFSRWTKANGFTTVRVGHVEHLTLARI